MRKEHKHHVVVISFMMLLVLAAFVFVILNRPASITTSLPYGPGALTAKSSYQAPATNSFFGNLEIDVLVGFLIILALLFIWYVAIHIAKELRNSTHKTP